MRERLERMLDMPLGRASDMGALDQHVPFRLRQDPAAAYRPARVQTAVRDLRRDRPLVPHQGLHGGSADRRGTVSAAGDQRTDQRAQEQSDRCGAVRENERPVRVRRGRFARLFRCTRKSSGNRADSISTTCSCSRCGSSNGIRTCSAITRRLFHHILIDEYQDTNHAQYRLVRLLTSQRKNLCVVGDDDQSIYKFRGADISNILNFEKDYPEAQGHQAGAELPLDREHPGRSRRSGGA